MTRIDRTADFHAPQRSDYVVNRPETHIAAASNTSIPSGASRSAVRGASSIEVHAQQQTDYSLEWIYSTPHLPLESESSTQTHVHQKPNSESYQACVAGVANVRQLLLAKTDADGIPYTPLARAQALMEAADDTHRMIERVLEEERTSLVWLGLHYEERRSLQEMRQEMKEVWKAGDDLFQEAHRAR